MGYGSTRFQRAEPHHARTTVSEPPTLTPPPPRLTRSCIEPTAAVRVDPTNKNTDWTEEEMKPHHWFTRTWLTNGRHAKLHTSLPMAAPADGSWLALTVALQVAFERQFLKPAFHLIGYRL
jgi:hypothetical protein